MSDIDRRIATEVMGWRAEEQTTLGGPLSVWINDAATPMVAVQHWSPSTRIDHAWEVLTMVAQTGWFVQTNIYHFPGQNECVVEFVRHDGKGFAEGYGPELPLAISKAALEAVK